MPTGSGRAPVGATTLEWAKDTILPIFTSHSTSIVSVVDGIEGFRQVALVTEDYDTLSPLKTSNNKPAIVGTAVGCSAFALLAGVASWLFIQRRNRNSNSRKTTKKKTLQKGGRSGGIFNSRRNLSKNIERVDIIANHFGQSDESFVEYVDSNDIRGDDSVSNAPTVEYKKVYSIESTILTKSQSYDSSNENDEVSFPLHSFDDSSMESSLKMDEFSEMSPYDEMAAHQIQKSFPIKSNHVKSVRFLNEMGEEAHIPERSVSLSPQRKLNPPEQAPSQSRKGNLTFVNEKEFNSMENTVDL